MDTENDPLFTGAIPWTADEYVATMEELRRLRATPLDDWKLPRPRTAAELQRSGPVWMVKPDNINFQLTGFLTRRHADDPQHVAKHMFRLHVINEFFLLHGQTLVRDGLANDIADQGIEIHPAVLEVVATARYEDRYIDEYGHEQCTFDYLGVLAEARRLIAEGV